MGVKDQVVNRLFSRIDTVLSLKIDDSNDVFSKSWLIFVLVVMFPDTAFMCVLHESSPFQTGVAWTQVKWVRRILDCGLVRRNNDRAAIAVRPLNDE